MCDRIATKPEAMPNCRPDNCSAGSGDSFEKQPPDFQLILIKSFRTKDNAAAWFAELDPERRMALTQIFNRLCRQGLLCQVRLVTKVVAGEPPIAFLDRLFDVPGSTPSVYFTGPNVKSLPQLLIDTGRYCLAHGLGASQHTGGPTLREISGSDSLHISVENEDEGLMEAHIDHYSPVPQHPGSTLCSNEPTAAAVSHIVRELVPEKVRKGWRSLSRGIIPVLGYLDIPGFQGFPDFTLTPTLPQPEPANRSDAVPPPVAGVTVRGPRDKPKPRKTPKGPDAGVLDNEVVERIRAVLEGQVSSQALLPSQARMRLREARRAADQAGPDEEAALNAARDKVEAATAEYADAHDVAFDLAVAMELARRSERTWVKLELDRYGNYGSLEVNSFDTLVSEIRRIALLLRRHLPDNARGVNTVLLIFGSGNSAVQKEIRLPGWVEREKGLFD
jgi:hypothetical protein